MGKTTENLIGQGKARWIRRRLGGQYEIKPGRRGRAPRGGNQPHCDSDSFDRVKKGAETITGKGTLRKNEIHTAKNQEGGRTRVKPQQMPRVIRKKKNVEREKPKGKGGTGTRDGGRFARKSQKTP